MRSRCVLVLSAVLVVAVSVDAARKPPTNVYASPKTAKEAGPDFALQGEYEGTVGGGKKIGVQVIALGKGAFQAMFLPGGLPGAGWDGKNKILCSGKLDGGKVVFKPATGQRRYMDGSPDRFSATRKFPPQGQKDYTATISADKLTGKTDAGEAIEAKKVMRKSPTLCAKPPAGATVLLAFEPGKPPSLDAWTNQKWLPKPCGCVHVRGGSSKTKEAFGGAWKLHVEFRTPFRSTARGQGRGNSGVYPPGGREIQVLDSFGLEGLPNECGGVYKSHACRVNMCLPPLSWQTFDITYTPPKPAKDGGKAEPATYDVVHNGVTIHEKVPLGGGRKGSLNLQDHGNPVSYRNIWIVKTK